MQKFQKIGIKLFNENKIDEWANAVAANDITFEDMTKS